MGLESRRGVRPAAQGVVAETSDLIVTPARRPSAPRLRNHH